MKVTPIIKYKADLASGRLQADSAQAQAMQLLQGLYEQLMAIKPPLSFFDKLIVRSDKNKQHIQGIYFWGGVGRGKTCLMDLFFHSLPEGIAMRMHFHRFMLRVHQELNSEENRGLKDPLKAVADTLASEANVLCFDEFFVSDIADAMILSAVLEALFARGVILLATSNVIPDDLYKNGLQRARFMPTIKLINQHCQVFNLDSGIDHRLRTLQQVELYHWPLDRQADINLSLYYKKLSSGLPLAAGHIKVLDRSITIYGKAEGVLYIDFSHLCQGARSQNDYIELARLYHTVLLPNVRQMNDDKNDTARRFIAMVDEFYERNVSLIISAEVPMSELYTGEQLAFEFKRCLSRLSEMQSKEYLAKIHLP